jgi:hypothetical protein
MKRAPRPPSTIADFRLTIAPPSRADGHWKELPRRFFNRQSAIGNKKDLPHHPFNRQSAISDRQ